MKFGEVLTYAAVPGVPVLVYEGVRAMLDESFRLSKSGLDLDAWLLIYGVVSVMFLAHKYRAV